MNRLPACTYLSVRTTWSVLLVHDTHFTDSPAEAINTRFTDGKLLKPQAFVENSVEALRRRRSGERRATGEREPRPRPTGHPPAALRRVQLAAERDEPGIDAPNIYIPGVATRPCATRAPSARDPSRPRGSSRTPETS